MMGRGWLGSCMEIRTADSSCWEVFLERLAQCGEMGGFDVCYASGPSSRGCVKLEREEIPKKIKKWNGESLK